MSRAYSLEILMAEGGYLDRIKQEIEELKMEFEINKIREVKFEFKKIIKVACIYVKDISKKLTLHR